MKNKTAVILALAIAIALIAVLAVVLLPGLADAGSNPADTDPVLESTPWSGASAVFVGDSITAGEKYTTKFYYAYLQEMLNLSSVQKQATSGSCISAKSDYGFKKSPLSSRYQTIPDGDLIMIFMGSNDFGHATPLGTIEDTVDISFYGALNTIIPYVQSTHPNSQIVMVTPIHRVAQSSGMDSASDSAPNKEGATLEDYANAIKDICKQYNLYCIDLFNLAEIDPNNKTILETCFNDDGLHPNAAGHEIIAKALAQELKNIPRKESSTQAP